MNTIYPYHSQAVYEVTEHTIDTCPPDLWPLIKAWLAKELLSGARRAVL